MVPNSAPVHVEPDICDTILQTMGNTPLVRCIKSHAAWPVMSSRK